MSDTGSDFSDEDQEGSQARQGSQESANIVFSDDDDTDEDDDGDDTAPVEVRKAPS
jgi:hypothetical protein